MPFFPFQETVFAMLIETTGIYIINMCTSIFNYFVHLKKKLFYNPVSQAIFITATLTSV